jgi:hypothetical protein
MATHRNHPPNSFQICHGAARDRPPVQTPNRQSPPPPSKLLATFPSSHPPNPNCPGSQLPSEILSPAPNSVTDGACDRDSCHRRGFQPGSQGSTTARDKVRSAKLFSRCWQRTRISTSAHPTVRTRNRKTHVKHMRLTGSTQCVLPNVQPRHHGIGLGPGAPVSGPVTLGQLTRGATTPRNRWGRGWRCSCTRSLESEAAEGLPLLSSPEARRRFHEIPLPWDCFIWRPAHFSWLSTLGLLRKSRTRLLTE